MAKLKHQNEQKCGNCRFYFEPTDEKPTPKRQGICRLNPPAIFPVMKMSGATTLDPRAPQPIPVTVFQPACVYVLEEGWCGQWDDAVEGSA